MCWEPAYALLILFSTIIDYFVGIVIEKSDNNKRRLRLLLISLSVNLGLLFTFKYYNFFSNSIQSLLSNFDIDYHHNEFDLLLPVGISFYTFQTLSYSIDLYRRKIPVERHFGKFALYVSFFPQLVAGPIERASNLLPQFKELKNRFKYSDFVEGVTRIIFGLFKKVVVADTIALYVDSIYNNYEIHNSASLVFATYAFAFQIYCDFSGYSDIAIGSARILGFDFMENFKIPYFSKNITEFWRRWHISLSSWLKDYLYIPLGGSRLGKLLTYRNLLITMLLGGLWHGASWNFVIWGALNGAFLSIEKYFNIQKFITGKSNILLKSVGVFITFNLICFTWIFFRSHTYEQAFGILSKISSMDSFMPSLQSSSIFMTIIFSTGLLVFVEYVFFRKKTFNGLLKGRGMWFPVLFNLVLLTLILLFGIEEGSQFIYFQF